MIPSHSQMYNWGDDQPLVGGRVAAKNLDDIQGLQAYGVSQCWVDITPLIDGSAPSIQKIIDLVVIIIGQYKLAQFATEAAP